MKLEDLPDTATVEEIALFERVDVRTIRKACTAGTLPGAYQRGRSWRVDVADYRAGRRVGVA